MIASCIGCDQVTKAAATTYLRSSPPVPVLGGLIRFQFIQNPGFFLSFGADMPGELRFWLFTVMVSMALAGLLIFALASRRLSGVAILSASLIVGGGSSNLIDRFLHQGAVIDIIDVTVGNYRSGIFNVADAAITMGLGLLLFHVMINRNKRKKKHA